MREWSELEDRYQQMMTSDPSAAQTFRQRMTAKFQANIQVKSFKLLLKTLLLKILTYYYIIIINILF